MKAGISNIWLLGMIATFIFLFSCYIIISVNYTKSFKMKNEILNIIEKGKGITTGGSIPGASIENAGSWETSSLGLGQVKVNVPSYQTINIYLLGNAYSARGNCSPKKGETWYGVKSLDTVNYTEVTESTKGNDKYYYCFAKYRYGGRTALGDNKNRGYYYRVKLFYKMELPVIDNWLSVKVEGDTAAIFDVQDGNKWKINTDNGYTT